MHSLWDGCQKKIYIDRKHEYTLWEKSDEILLLAVLNIQDVVDKMIGKSRSDRERLLCIPNAESVSGRKDQCWNQAFVL